MGDPIEVPADADDALLESKRLELETVLNAATSRAYELAGGDIRRAIPLDQLAAISPPEPGFALKTYRIGTSVLRPAVPLLLNVRGQQGKEDIEPSRRTPWLCGAPASRRPGRLGARGERRRNERHPSAHRRHP